MVTKLKREAIKNYCSNSTSTTSTEFWKKMKPLLPMSKNQTDQQIQLVDNGKLIADTANFLNEYYTTPVIGKIVDISEENFENHPSVQEIRKHSNLVFSFQTVDSNYIQELINAINVNKAPGYDNISPKLLKLSSDGITELLTKLFNYCIVNTTWPTEWKLSNICLQKR
jgi:hypothetical protein